MASRSGSHVVRRAPELGWLLAGYTGIAGFFAIEAAVRKPSASGLEASDDDRGTTRAIVAASVAAAILPALLRSRRTSLPGAAAPIGTVVQAAGLGLRVWSMHILGSSYTRTLRAEEGQRVIDAGPYRRIRHPGYAGSLLIWMGFGLTTRSLPTLAVVGTLLGVAYRKRIRAEEQLLERELRGYADYRRRTKRLIPFIW